MKKLRFSAKYERLLKTLRAARQEAGLTQGEVAEHFQAHAPLISKIESGERRIDVVELAELCHVYGVQLRDLLTRAGIE